VWGAGVTLRRTDLLTIYECPGLPILGGRTGALSVAGGDDVELCWAVTVLDRKLIYDDRLILHHFMPRERLKIEYLQRMIQLPDQSIEGSMWTQRFHRFTAGLAGMETILGRLNIAGRSVFGWLRYWYRREERGVHALMLLAACGWTAHMTKIERTLYVA